MKCQHVKKNSQQCGAHAMKNGTFCYLHNPNIPDSQKKAFQIQGGRSNIVKLSEGLPPITIKTHQDIVTLLEDTVNRVRAGELDIRIANTLAYIAGHLIKALEITEVGKRVETIERVIYERGRRD